MVGPMTDQMKHELRDYLERVAEYMDDRADADHNGISFIANEEMVLLTETKGWLEALS
jgi:hypothetical protein